MTVTQRKRAHVPDEIQAVSEPGLQITCDSCSRDLTHSIRIKCADLACEADDGVDICPSCFCSGQEFKSHKRWHPYRVVELHSYPIFQEDWGADEELLLIEGIALQGLGNWQEIAKHVGTRTKEEVEEHYFNVYINSPNWPLPRMDQSLDVDPTLFHERKRRRISSMTAAVANSKPVPAPTSAPGVHEITSFLPGRLEFEHELDNDAEDLVKDLEFGVVLEYGGDKMPVDRLDVDVVARSKLEEERRKGRERALAQVNGDPSVMREGSTDRQDVMAALVNGYDVANGHAEVRREKLPREPKEDGKDKEAEAESEEPVLPPPYETRDSINFKLALLGMYNSRLEKRNESKAVMFDRGFMEFKKLQAYDKKRPREEKDIVQRIKPLAKLQTAEDYDNFVDGILWEAILRKRIQELQHYRKMGLRTVADIERYDADVARRNAAKSQMLSAPYDRLRVGNSRGSAGPDARRAGSVASFADTDAAKDSEAPARPSVSGSGSTTSFVRRQPAPLNLANSPSLHLLTVAEQTLCATLRIMPRIYLAIKETLVREYAKRGGELRRREARDLVKIDVNKTNRIWDFLHQAGFLKSSLVEHAEDRDAGGIGIGSVTVPPSNAETPASTVIGTPTLTQAGSITSSFATPRTSQLPLMPTNNNTLMSHKDPSINPTASLTSWSTVT